MSERETLRRVQDGLFPLRKKLAPLVEARMKRARGQDWLRLASRAAGGASDEALYAYGLLKAMIDNIPPTVYGVSAQWLLTGQGPIEPGRLASRLTPASPPAREVEPPELPEPLKGEIPEIPSHGDTESRTSRAGRQRLVPERMGVLGTVLGEVAPRGTRVCLAEVLGGVCPGAEPVALGMCCSVRRLD